MFSTALADNTLKAAVKETSGIAAFFEQQFRDLTAGSVLAGLGLGLLVGLLIAFTYKICYRGGLYSPNFSLTLIMLTVITTPVVMCIGSSIALSMGMVGALSIVRFRTAVKDPLDTAYMFWAITMGILVGSNASVIAIVALLGIGGILLAISFFRLRAPNSYLLVLHYDEDAQIEIDNRLKQRVKTYRLRSKTISRQGAEMTVEVRLDRQGNIVSEMLDVPGVYDATLVACQTEAGA